MGLTGLGKIVSQIIRQIAHGLEYVGDKVSHYIRLALHYLYEFAKAFYHYLGKLYDTFQRDPIRFLQFAGSLAIMTYYGVL
ncbi:hypothetical protein [Deltalipothrixvirus pozzuoliense]|uniref:Uncharacterized protein ORF90 n=1 Tax=Acidianus filamentous virus 2 (isolate Italy/Pozzuoli) TaxID=654910 RepID=Y090_AFV2P|nr:hypothetical protein AFV2_gp38 [Acidianus filamentous virus 2]Q573D1.1 RecName: Full=Uncharacterized protein ORF90 [Acidianus filamentous virus 2 (isolate Pozzuoli)]CAH69425.1 hypothetical protein [Acidianus filamentous virus 2]